MNKFFLYFNTIRHLRLKQVIYQLLYRLKPKRKWDSVPGIKTSSEYGNLIFSPWIDKYPSLDSDVFKFLNLRKQFFGFEVDWNFAGFGKLWNFNLNYMDFLLQTDLESETGLKLMHNYAERLNPGSTGLEPYPISLRGINWIKFFSKNKIQDKNLDSSLRRQYGVLFENPEYHLMGNHLLENGFSLLFAAFYFRDKILYNKAKEIISTELKEQVLNDGAHFELSPMYHQIILDRLLDSVNLLQNNKHFKDQAEFLNMMQLKASSMIIWLNAISFQNGEIPLLNDSARGIAPTSIELSNYALRLGIVDSEPDNNITLLSSGYRRFGGSSYDCIADTGSIGPDYQPGHAHADSFTFELYFNGKPLIVDTGVSTYEKNSRRQLERSTISHNTVEVGSRNSSQVWDGFRVGTRAEVISTEETDKERVVRHNGYRNFGIIHERKFSSGENSFSIEDRLVGKKKLPTLSRFHFHPDSEIRTENNIIFFQGGHLALENIENFAVRDYLYAPEFNVLIPGKVVEVSFKDNMKATFNFSR